MKDYIRDEGKVRNCVSNESKMNIFEHMYYDLFQWKFFEYSIPHVIEDFIEGFKTLGIAILNTICIILFPITLLIRAINGIKYAKKKMERHKKMWDR